MTSTWRTKELTSLVMCSWSGPNFPPNLVAMAWENNSNPNVSAAFVHSVGSFFVPQHARLQVLETAQVGAGVLRVVIVVPFPKLRPQSIAVQEQPLLLIVQRRRGESKDVCFEQTTQKHDEALEHAQMQASGRVQALRHVSVASSLPPSLPTPSLPLSLPPSLPGRGPSLATAMFAKLIPSTNEISRWRFRRRIASLRCPEYTQDRSSSIPWDEQAQRLWRSLCGIVW